MGSGLLINRRDDHPCRKCQNRALRPGCRDTCQKIKNWNAEGEQIKAARKEYYDGLQIRRRK